MLRIPTRNNMRLSQSGIVFIARSGRTCNVSAQAGRAEEPWQTGRPNPALPAAYGSPSDDQILCAARLSSGLRSPARGGMIIARARPAGAQRRRAAALGQAHPVPNLPFFEIRFCPEDLRGKIGFQKTGENHFTSVTQGGARSSLALGYSQIVPPGLRFDSLRSHFSLRRTKEFSGKRQSSSCVSDDLRLACVALKVTKQY